MAKPVAPRPGAAKRKRAPAKRGRSATKSRQSTPRETKPGEPENSGLERRPAHAGRSGRAKPGGEVGAAVLPPAAAPADPAAPAPERKSPVKRRIRRTIEIGVEVVESALAGDRRSISRIKAVERYAKLLALLSRTLATIDGLTHGETDAAAADPAIAGLKDLRESVARQLESLHAVGK